jgi:hypothetical protein
MMAKTQDSRSQAELNVGDGGAASGSGLESGQVMFVSPPTKPEAGSDEPVSPRNEQFSIDELRAIAAHFGVPNWVKLTESADLITAIRNRL